VIAFAFALLSAFQPGFFAMANAAGMHSERPATEIATIHAEGHGSSAVLHIHDGEEPHDPVAPGSSGHGGDKGCEVHCTPAHAIPVACAQLPDPCAGGYDGEIRTAAAYGLTLEFIRPPRT
jgi:hypothetical protein